MDEKEMVAALIALGYTVIAPKTKAERERERIMDALWERERREALAYGEQPNAAVVEQAYDDLMKGSKGVT